MTLLKSRDKLLVKINKANESQKGQMLMIVVLIMVVALTVGLAVASRSITSLRTTTEEENSQRAFSAAEAGVERVLKLNLNQEGGVGVIADENFGSDPNSTIKNVDISKISGTEILLNGGEAVQKDDGADVWLIEHDNDGRPDYSTRWTGDLTIYFGQTTNCGSSPTPPALEVIVISGTLLSPVSTRYALDSCARSNNFLVVNPDSYTILTKLFKYKYTISISDGLIARVIPLYSGTIIAVTGTNNLPSQGRKIDSVGASGGTERKVTFYQGYSKLPAELFQHGIFWTAN